MCILKWSSVRLDCFTTGCSKDQEDMTWTCISVLLLLQQMTTNNGLSNSNILSYSFGGHISKVGVTELKSKY